MRVEGALSVTGLVLALGACSRAAPLQASQVSGAASPEIVFDAGAVPAADAGAVKAKPPSIGVAPAKTILFLEQPAPPCAGDDAEKITCLIGARYRADPAARVMALDLYAHTGDVAGLEHEHTMNGGYRGMLHLVPVLPVGPERPHLERVSAALTDYDAFFAALARDDKSVAYRWRAISFRFFRSVHARTPSAYALDWSIGYNVAGSLNGSADSVRETLFHEIFHLNDAAHGDERGNDWSTKVLGSIYDSVVHRCGAKAECLTPFAPNSTMVRGGTYYAFQPGNDVREYAAELAIRYYREQRGMLKEGPVVTPAFKCGRTENAQAWTAITAEFFGGIDLVPACARAL